MVLNAAAACNIYGCWVLGVDTGGEGRAPSRLVVLGSLWVPGYSLVYMISYVPGTPGLWMI